MRLEDKVAVITGGASGIGRAIAQLFAEEGARIVIGDISPVPREGGEPTAEIIERRGGTVIYRHCDVTSWSDVDGLIQAAVDAWGKLDLMVNNAVTRGSAKPLLETSEEEWDQVMAVNAKGVFFGCKRAVQQMLTQPLVGDARGRIINITSQHGMSSAPGKLAYGTSKAAAVYITRQVAVDYAQHGIICNAVAPGRILTGAPLDGPGADPLDYSRSRTPMPRLGEVQDVARAALFLASDEATFVTGHNLMVDGGWMAY